MSITLHQPQISTDFFRIKQRLNFASLESEHDPNSSEESTAGAEKSDKC